MTAPAMPPRIVLATRPVDFRKQIDALAGVVENELGLDPYSGVAVVFRCEEQRDQIKVLWWDGASLVLAHKRLEQGRFIWPSARDGMIRLRRTEFELLFAGLDWRRMLDPQARTRGAAPQHRGSSAPVIVC